MAELSGLDMVREIIGQINNLRRLVTINGKKFKWDGKKYVRAVDGKKFTKKELVSYVKDERFRAPGTDRPSKDTSRPRKPSEELKTTKITKDSKGRRVVDPEGNKLKIKRQDIKGDIKNKVKSVTSNIKKTTGQTVNAGNKLLQNAKLRFQNFNPQGNTKLSNALKMNKYLRQNVTRPSSGIKGNIGQVIAGTIADKGLNWAMGPLNRRTAANLGVSEEEYLAWLNNPNIFARMPGWEKRDADKEVANKIKIARQPTVTRNRRGQVTSTQQPVGRNWQNPYMGPPQPNISYEPEKVVPPPNQNTDSTNQKETVDQNKVKVVNPATKSPIYNLPSSNVKISSTKKKNKDKNKVLMIGDKKASSIQKKLLKAGFTEEELLDLVTAYNEKYRNKRGW
tara:strand:+ start:239 stop:1420 length:1182 start_codon:yes stop_codon:yes gene_type:complete